MLFPCQIKCLCEPCIHLCACTCTCTCIPTLFSSGAILVKEDSFLPPLCTNPFCQTIMKSQDTGRLWSTWNPYAMGKISREHVYENLEVHVYVCKTSVVSFMTVHNLSCRFGTMSDAVIDQVKVKCCMYSFSHCHVYIQCICMCTWPPSYCIAHTTNSLSKSSISEEMLVTYYVYRLYICLTLGVHVHRGLQYLVCVCVSIC